MKIRVIIDGTEVVLPVLNDVCVIVELDDSDDLFDALHHTFTTEGAIVRDLIEAGGVGVSDCREVGEIVEELVDFET